MHLAEHLAAIDGLLAHPGPRAVDLLTSEAFWEDDGTARPEAEAAFAADCEALVTWLSERWGEPAPLDLTGHLLRLLDGDPVPEPLAGICGHVRLLHLWRTGPGGRWLGVGIGRHGQEQPIQLVAATGDAASAPFTPDPRPDS
ncbi:hypothetical protein LHJ74_29325 [Streptomyces sp. N2-109]|uniref:Uncharacterized protein n=1 Tax=Streptomyces gossypii TaxID=2883101 RepID=A0ABT2K1B1_9ACTN|nr:hypothetical protein [Streptomyces gossypii]MCT2593962.1 hypothetical protein [Streptomyces gossypii]